MLPVQRPLSGSKIVAQAQGRKSNDHRASISAEFPSLDACFGWGRYSMLTAQVDLE